MREVSKAWRELQTMKSSMIDTTWRHKRTGGRYCVFLLALNSDTLEIEVVYFSKQPSPVMWTRPLTEFMDGRFERVHDTIEPL